MTEAVTSGKPLVVIPMFGDQFYNAKSAEQAGIAVQLHYRSITEANLKEAISTVISQK